MTLKHVDYSYSWGMLKMRLSHFPISGETDEDFSQTVELIKDYKLSQVHISQFYPRPGKLSVLVNVIWNLRSGFISCDIFRLRRFII